MSTRLVYLLATTLALGCGGARVDDALENEGTTSDEVATRSSRHLPTTDAGFVAVVVSQGTSSVSSRRQAKIAETLVSMGDEVKKGDALVRLDAAQAQNDLEAAKADVASATAAYQSAKLDVEDAAEQLALEKRLFAEGVTARESVRKAKIRYRKSQAGAARAKAGVSRVAAVAKGLARQLREGTIRAPSDGVVSALTARSGDLVQAGEPILRLVSGEGWQVRFAVPAEQRSALKEGAAARFTAEKLSSDLELNIRRISPELEPPLQLVVVDATFSSPPKDMNLLAGAVGRVRLSD